jgi:DNA-binding CsgD family transcriptional regulator
MGMKNLSAQERRCLHFLRLGMSYKEIASEMVLSPRTVETYVGNVRKKTHLKKRSELVQFYLRYLE